MTEFAMDVRGFAELVENLEADVDRESMGSLVTDIDQGLICWAMLEEANRTLARTREALAAKLAAAWPCEEERGRTIYRPRTVEGAGTFERHGKRDRKKWDREALLHDVLDTRCFDPETGADESQLTKVLHVWNLGSPRVTALRERGLDPDDYCESEFAGFTIQRS